MEAGGEPTGCQSTGRRHAAVRRVHQYGQRAAHLYELELRQVSAADGPFDRELHVGGRRALEAPQQNPLVQPRRDAQVAWRARRGGSGTLMRGCRGRGFGGVWGALGGPAGTSAEFAGPGGTPAHPAGGKAHDARGFRGRPWQRSLAGSNPTPVLGPSYEGGRL